MMSQHDTPKSFAGTSADLNAGGDHEVDLLLNEIDQRLAQRDSALPADAGDSVMTLERPSNDGGPATYANSMLSDEPVGGAHQVALGEALAAVAPAGAAAAAAAAEEAEAASAEEP